MSTSKPVLIFGAAGGVGRSAALAAAKRGAKVWLAMRDTKKVIPGLSQESEEAAGFTRIQADLASPESITAAVAKSGAKTAFLYTLHDSNDFMQSAFEALKKAGITYAVLLSSWGVQPTAEEAMKLSFIPMVHAATEIKLRESGIDYVALRPAWFNTNFFWLNGFKTGHVATFGVASRNDYLAPEDIGAVAGNLLTSSTPVELGKREAERCIYLCGPKVMSLTEAVGIIGDVLGKDIQVEEIGEAKYRELRVGAPKPLVDSMVEVVTAAIPPNNMYPEQVWKEGVDNIRRYAQREPTALRDWVEANKDGLA